MQDASESRGQHAAGARPSGHPAATPSPALGDALAADVDLFSDAAEMRRTITETSPDFIVVITPDGVIRYINRVLPEFRGIVVVGTSVFDHVLPDDHHGMHVAFARVLKTGKLDSYETSYQSPDLGRLTFECRVAPIFRNGNIVGFTLNARDVTIQKRTEAALHDALKNQRALIDQSPVGIVTICRAGRIISANPAYHAMLGYECGTLDGKTVVELTHPDDIDATVNLLHALVAGTAIECSLEKRYRREDGEYIWTRVSASAIRDDHGQFMHGVAVVEDVTDRIQAERQQRMLMRELDHRVKNNLAAIVSLVSQTIATSKSLDAFERTFIGRVTAMARSHEALAHAHWSDLELRTALSATLATYVEESAPRVRFEGEPVKLDSRTVMPLCLAIHELATNAMRHGALSSLDGRVSITWSTEQNRLHIRWRESGGPSVTPPAAPGLGMQLIEGFVRFELHGSLEFRFAPDGLQCDIAIPINEAD